MKQPKQAVLLFWLLDFIKLLFCHISSYLSSFVCNVIYTVVMECVILCCHLVLFMFHTVKNQVTNNTALFYKTFYNLE